MPSPDGASPRVLVERNDREGAHALRLSGGQLSLESVARPCPNGLPFPDGCAAKVPGRDFYDARVGATPSPAARFYARRVVRLARGGGRAVALVTPGGALQVSLGGRVSRVGGQGAALAAADVGRDGELDLLTSAFVGPRRPDRLRVFRVAPGRAPRVVWESGELPGRVLLAASGRLFAGRDVVFAALESDSEGVERLWVVEP